MHAPVSTGGRRGRGGRAHTHQYQREGKGGHTHYFAQATNGPDRAVPILKKVNNCARPSPTGSGLFCLMVRHGYRDP